MAARGTWNVDKAIVSHWDASGLDAQFRRFWSGRGVTEYPVLHDREARPQPPGPYCVFEIDQATIDHHSTGPPGDNPHLEHQVLRVPLQFTIHAIGDAATSGKKVAVTLASRVADAYDDARLDLSEDSQVALIKEPDFGAREGDEHWMWVVPYTLVMNAVLPRTVRSETLIGE